MTVWIYVNAAKQVGDKDHLKVSRVWTQRTPGLPAGGLEARGIKFVGAPSTTRIDPRGGPADQFSIRIEGGEEVVFVRRQIRYEAIERLSRHKERTFNGAVIAPETNRIPSRIKASAKIGKD